MLIAAAAQQWQVAPTACRAENGIVHGPGGKQLSFGKLATQAA
jgi:isoquinoline 1-oxidoreductase beta subunit